MHRIFSGNGQLVILSTRKPAPDRRPSRLLVHKPFVLLILCILCIDVQNNIDSLRRSRPIRAAEMPEAVPRMVRASRPHPGPSDSS